MTVLKLLGKPALKRQIKKMERVIERERNVFRCDESNLTENVEAYAEHLDACLVDSYQEIEATYRVFMKKYSYPAEVTIMSKVETDEVASMEYMAHISHWDIKK